MALAPPAHQYDYGAAVTYASNHWGGSGAPYNNDYVNYNGCGGDCANFVSQSFFKGNQVPDSHWYRYIGDQCGYSGRFRGSDVQWYNNWGLRNWAINQGRGTDKGGIGGVGKGDIINYDWDQNGSFQHVAMVSDGANNLVTAHNNDHWNFPWQLGDSTANHKFTNMATYYEA
jgi:hypothetical protein